MGHKNFTIVDRHQIESVISELKLQGSGLVSKESRGQLGEILGASHLWFMSVNLVFYETKCRFSLMNRLVETESGKVVASMMLNDERSFNIPDKQAFLLFMEQLKAISPIEKEALDAINAVRGDNDDIIYRASLSSVILKYQVFSDKLKNIKPENNEINVIHAIYVEAANYYSKAFDALKNGIEKKDKALIEYARRMLKSGTDNIAKYNREIKKLTEKYRQL